MADEDIRKQVDNLILDGYVKYDGDLEDIPPGIKIAYIHIKNGQLVYRPGGIVVFNGKPGIQLKNGVIKNGFFSLYFSRSTWYLQYDSLKSKDPDVGIYIKENDLNDQFIELRGVVDSVRLNSRATSIASSEFTVEFENF